MSTVLTNGVIIPENGSRNWGGDLANNWNILDVNVGYMNDVKNKVTTLENSLSNYVDLSSEQTISGTKIFSGNLLGSGSNDLGTSTNKWKTLNGVNPGALSLPNHNSYLDIKGNLPASVSDNAWIARYHITPEQDGILILVLNDCSGVVVWNGLDLPSYGDRDTSINLEKRVMAFVLKGVTYGIYTTDYSQIATARLFYCQGNV